MAVLRGRYRLSLDDAAEFLNHVCNLPLSGASIVTGYERTSEALADDQYGASRVYQSPRS